MTYTSPCVRWALFSCQKPNVLRSDIPFGVCGALFDHLTPFQRVGQFHMLYLRALRSLAAWLSVCIFVIGAAVVAFVSVIMASDGFDRMRQGDSEWWKATIPFVCCVSLAVVVMLVVWFMAKVEELRAESTSKGSNSDPDGWNDLRACEYCGTIRRAKKCHSCGAENQRAPLIEITLPPLQ